MAQNDLSLGPLRLTNPDEASPGISRDVPLNSYLEPSQASDETPVQISNSRDARSSPDPQTQNRRHSIFNLLRRGESEGTSPPRNASRGSEPKAANTRSESSGSESFVSHKDPLARSAAAKAYRQSMPSNHQAQQQAQFPPYQAGAMQNGNRGYPPPGPGRPVSGIYSAQPPSGAMPSREYGSQRLRTESSKLPITGVPSRSDSRAAAAAMQAGVPSREPSHRERAYSSNNPIPAGNAPAPPRRSSRGMGGGHTDSTPGASSSSAPRYDLDGILVPSNEEWKDKGAAVGVREEYDANGKLVLRQVKKGVRDFAFGRNLGEGSYSTVVLATDRQTLKEYAVKILDKKHIIKEKKIKYVNIEKDTLNRLIEHPGIIRLYYTFQDSSSLYYVLDVASGGELLGVLKKIGSFDEECTKFYGAQILDAIEHMHNRGVIHRDLKPENVLLDDQMHVKITDFGTAKLLPDPRIPKDPTKPYDFAAEEEESTRARSFVGTAEYVSPELLTDKNACKASDLWAFGCIIYQLLSGRPPFKASNEYQTFQKIVGLDYQFPPGFPSAARDLVERLLVLDPQRRLSIEHIKNHEFFDGVQFGRGLWRMKAPRLKPYIPPTQEPNLIKLNGGGVNSGAVSAGSGYSSVPQPISTSRAGPNSSNGSSRPQPRVITELPPPTQLDIEWSPVLTRNNERILKLGNLMVLSAPLPNSPNSRNGEHEPHEKSKLSRFFGGSTTKKRQRLVMVTSSARIILAAAGGDEKKTKSEISLLASECSWRTHIDSKGQQLWCVNTRGTHYTFEDSKSSVTTGDPSKSSAQEWIESIERAKDMALSQNMGGSYNSETGFDMGSSVSSPSSTIHGTSVYPEGFSITDRAGRNHLTKSQASLGGEDTSDKATMKKSHRFSKRQSKNGLSTPF
ncbi:probable 3-phosphoinositide-dependent protein kinase 1 [Rhynchosporium agropyri]|uniref:non-specific serine/threonine protein kinase n=1 Tax=Rhynchosporium agropyri TaxID=914238 RepID=A0A1E1KH75_9HELO|nr:probable 3-phosphoinositide-dependent protein kinase 1 [Rhynchosporium agropyri]